jgi:hypothetical protein
MKPKKTPRPRKIRRREPWPSASYKKMAELADAARRVQREEQLLLNLDATKAKVN